MKVDELRRELESAFHTMLGSAAIDGSACTVNLEYLNANARFQAALSGLVKLATARPSADDAPRVVAESNFPETNGWVRRRFLADGARFKLSSSKNGAKFDGFPAELSGRWVALVAAENDQHLRAAPPADARDAGQRIQDEYDARRYRWLRAADCPSAQVIIDLAHDHSILADSEALDQHIDRAMGGDQ